MKANEIRKMNAEQLNEKLTGLKKDLFMHGFDFLSHKNVLLL